MQINLNVNRSLLTNINKLSQIHRRYESLWTVEQGPKNPYYRDGVTPGMRNHLGARSAGGRCSPPRGGQRKVNSNGKDLENYA